MAKSRSVPPMSRVMLRSEFEKRLADYSTQMLKALKTYEHHWNERLAAQDAATAELRQRIDDLVSRNSLCAAPVGDWPPTETTAP